MNLYFASKFHLLVALILLGARLRVKCTKQRGQPQEDIVKPPCNLNCESLGNWTSPQLIQCRNSGNCAQNHSISFDCRARRRRHRPILNCLGLGGKSRKCGKLSTEIDGSSIQNGITVNSSSWPWHASIFRRSSSDSHSSPVFVCSGTLIRIHNAFKILTAAHCVVDRYGKVFPNENYEIVLGSDLSEFEMAKAQKSAQIMKVLSTKVSENYNIYTYDSDIAILSIPRVKLSQFAQPICIRQNKHKRSNDSVHRNPIGFGYTTGFGINQFFGVSKQLKQAIIPVVEKSTCENVSGEVINEAQFCGGELHGTLICQGNSGSGLYVRENPNGPFMLMGIVSHTSARMKSASESASPLPPPRCNPEKYTIFTNVSYFVEWIKTGRSNEMLQTK